VRITDVIIKSFLFLVFDILETKIMSLNMFLNFDI